ncbi:unnamed protein product, partial [Adineta steineri]
KNISMFVINLLSAYYISSLEGYSRNQTAPMSPRSYSAYSNAYGPSASSYGVPSPGFLNGMTNLMSSAFSTIGPFGTLSSASSALTSSQTVTPYGQTPINK